jgi:hypothetical protein
MKKWVSELLAGEAAVRTIQHKWVIISHLTTGNYR